MYIEFLANAAPTFTETMVGPGSSGIGLNIYLGGSNYGVGIYDAQTLASSGFTANYNSGVGPSPNDVWAMAIDFGAGSVWGARNNVWFNSSNPATGTLPIASFVPATVGALFAGLSFNYAGHTWTLQPTAASQTYAPPSGFSAWDASAVVKSAQARVLVMA